MDEKVEQYSLDKKHKLTFYGFEEPRMAMSICRFSLTNVETNEILEFNPLWAIGIGQNGFSWSENQNFFSINLVNPQKGNTITENFFIYNIRKGQFSSIHFSAWNLIGHCHNDYIEIEYGETIEGAHDIYPTKDIRKPENIQFYFSDFQWTDIADLEQFNVLNENAIIHKFKPIDNGWRLFKGQLPQSTEILIERLKKFADYGDTQSKEWLAEINAKTNKIDCWVNASHYLGLKTRK